ncbi:MAG TPA: hypothetical protein VLL08_08705 [Kineosporiaceae bacterium]|nr:hypothetical protein [Kineosporiaceae bacterium]
MNESVPNETVAALISAANLCWTQPAQASLVKRGTTASDGQRVLGEFLLIPSARRPRLLVPAGRPAAAAESVRRFSQALSWPERVLRTVLSAGLRSGALDAAVPDRLRVTVPTEDEHLVDSLQDEVSRLLGEPVLLSLGVGTPRANRKPVLQAISRRGRALAFVKLADTDVTRGLLVAEAHALTQLAARPPAGLLIPRLIHLGPWNGIDLLIQSALHTPPWLTHSRSSAPHAAMRSLLSAFDAGHRPVTGSAGWQRLVDAPKELTDAARSERFTAVIEACAVRLDGRELRHSAWHGDWTPWNMAWVRDEVRIWDWERFAEDVPAGLDALHYALAPLAMGTDWDSALRRLHQDAGRVLAPLEIPATDAESVFLMYLLDLGRRYLLAAQPEVGRPLRHRADGLLRYLSTMTGTAATQAPLPDWRMT